MFLGRLSMGATGIGIWRMVEMAMLHPPSTARADAQGLAFSDDWHRR